MSIPLGDRLASSLSARLRRRYARAIQPRPELTLEKLGTAYGGWVVPTTLIDGDWIVYDGGVGEDASFAVAMIERYGTSVFAFDPTPRAIAFVEAQLGSQQRFRFLPVGLWSSDTTLRFWAPRDPTHVSHSILNLQQTDEAFEAPCRTVASLMSELGHARIDVLKLDIEGAEHEVIRSVLEAGIRPQVICTEIDRPVRPITFWRTIRRIQAAGYVLVAVDDWNFTFVRRDRLAAALELHAAVARNRGRPRVTFGVIVLNGEPFTRYLLRSLYPFAHEIIVVEGSAPGGRNVANPDGHSSDGTLDILRTFKRDEDPDAKVTIVTAEDEGHPDGFWPGEKDEQSRAYASRATGDYLWQVDIDEFYRTEDVERVLYHLMLDPTITAVTFKQTTFWGGLGFWVDGWYLRRGATYYHRLFKWGPGYRYSSHRPPTVLDPAGRNLRSVHWLSGEDTARLGIRLFHYSLLVPKQVIEKCDYYANAPWAKRAGALEWANDAWMALRRPYHVHNVYDHPSWLERYEGDHPDEVVRMVDDLRASGDPNALRRTDDIERLLASPSYRLGRAVLKARLALDLPIAVATLPRRIPAALARRGRKQTGRVRRLGGRILRRLGLRRTHVPPA